MVVQFPGEDVQFPWRECAVPGAAKVPAKVPVKGAEIAQSAKIAPLTTRMTKLKRRMTKLNERRSQTGGGALFASAGSGFVDPQLTDNGGN